MEYELAENQIHRDIVELTKELISIPSTNSKPEEINRCAAFIEDWLLANDIAFSRHDEGSTPSIHALPSPGYAPVLLMTHFDVVESEDDSLFVPREIDGRLYGRGSIDDKYGVALSLILMREHIKQNRKKGLGQNDLPFGILLTGDEEVGGAHGAKQLSHSITTDFFIAIDGGNPELIVTKEKGIISLELTAKGKAAHAARPWLGKSAFEVMIDDYNKIKSLFTDETADHWHRTMVLTKCRAGNGSSNIVPDQACSVYDIRYTDNDDPDLLVNSMKQLVSSEMKVNAIEPVFKSAPSDYLDLLVDHSKGAQVGFEHGASDARYFSSLNIPGAIWGADGEMSQHTLDEHIVISSLCWLYDTLDNYLNHIPIR